MKKEELIDKYEKKYETIFGFPVIQLNQILEDLKQLDEPQKPVVPQFVADLIEYAKKSDWDLEDTFQDIAGNDGSSDIYQWYYSDSNNMETFARAWLDGYEVEKEKRYKVKVKGVYFNSGLVFDKTNKKWFFSSIYEVDHQRGHHTRKELEEAGFGEVFNSPLFEVEEMEGEI